MLEILKENNNYNKKIIRREDGSSFNLVEVKADSNTLKFIDIDSNNSKKRFNIGRLRILKNLEIGIGNPLVIVWNAFSQNKRYKDCFREEFVSAENDEFLSLNSFINFKLRNAVRENKLFVENGVLKLLDSKNNYENRLIREILQFLYSEDRIEVFAADNKVEYRKFGDDFSPERDIVPVASLAYPGEIAEKKRYELVFNTSYFTLEAEDYISNYSLLGESYNLQITDGEILRPPIYKRSALLKKTDGKWDFKKLSLKDLSFKIANRDFSTANFTLNNISEYALYNRLYGVGKVGRTLGKTPERKGQVDLIIINKSVVGIRYFGGAEIPQNGFVISIPYKEWEKIDKNNLEVIYYFSDGSNYKSAIQCGPGLVDNHELMIDENFAKAEDFYKKHRLVNGSFDYGVVPTDYAADIDKTRAARMVLCIDDNEIAYLLAVESANSGAEMPCFDSTGATLLEMAELALERGYKYALNLDGGGSTNLIYHYGSLVKTADRRGLPGVVYERMIPSVGVIKNNLGGR